MPRGGFSAALLECGVDLSKVDKDIPLDTQEQAELLWLRNRVTTLEAQLRMNGITPITGSVAPPFEAKAVAPSKLESQLKHFIYDCGLEEYEDILVRQGYTELSTILHMQESHMRNLGMSAGHALKFYSRIQEQKAQFEGMYRDGTIRTTGEQLEELAFGNTKLQYGPGIYRCVHGPRVAIRASPNTTGQILESLRPGDLIRIADVVPPCWGKVDESELWARFTAVFPRKPRVMKALGDDGELLTGEEEEDDDGPPLPRSAFVLIDGKEVGIDGPLIKKIPPEESKQAIWPFRDALEVRCSELDAASLRRQPTSREALRKKVVETAKKYVGTPFAKCYHDPSDSRYLQGSDVHDSALFLDNKQFVIRVVEDLKVDFGFMLDLQVSVAHLYDLLSQHELRDEKSLEPGDLIFYEVYNRKTRRARIVHVEFYVGGRTNTLSVGSVPWSASSRTGGKDGIQLFNDYNMDSWEGEKVLGLRCCSIRSWLESGENSFAHGQLVRQQRRVVANSN